MPDVFHDADRCAEAIVDRIGHEIRLAVPISIGKPLLLLDALYRLAEADRRVQLTIFTGLTLTRPHLRSSLERRFAQPLLDRLFDDCPEPLYAAAQQQDRLPPNIRINEFFLLAGASLANKRTQRSYICLNYSHVARYLESAETNVFAQLVAPHRSAPRVSLSSNTDVTLDILPYIARRRTEKPTIFAAELNTNLPYMPGEAEIELAEFDAVLDPESHHYGLFAPPKEPVSLADFAMALHAACLVKDGGTLQIGIGSFSDALTHALVLRHTNNGVFRDLLKRLGSPPPESAELNPFAVGLYGCTEMLVDGFLALKNARVLKRRVSTLDGKTALLHAAFFIGNQAFYRHLREMPAEELAEISMTAVSYTNTLTGDAERKRAERRHARFINTALTATLLGAVSSDALEDGRVVSGVGGQHDLVTMAHELADARAIIGVRSTRYQGRKVGSNITWTYANTTIPRALRDIIVTEYGIADIKGKSDRDTIAAMISIADSRFQHSLRNEAQRAGKLEPSFSLPSDAIANSPERLEAALGPARREGLLPMFPLGSDMSTVEQSLVTPLLALKRESHLELLRIFLAGLTGATVTSSEAAALERLGLAAPAGLEERALRALVKGALRRHS
ncbi:acetyl-CoA hydrolase/transferase C-terminal domain-containing protein [Hyphomicrobium sp.]|uniref:acetyl-CoA hydrolase/transferase C-terminal domain-containing protein n=1 Tax=Hyphomicrobium sp. TaxID=82 RepID=UPI001D6B05DB|nr:acetyl-CoA hydrolase/transferase C-terminal domain-containing protein [Hyphomicrobium sp.]MBY0558959.1 acetyl-CoA hydrolase [Hyphomicrobium sp.]